ncbi:MAG TPA: hypothetical protein VOA88_08410 [Candidatus Dormibacteraeota bacterium]|nr:hypothetical protein [Candidatus Dormibacteraeota bacterium]
MTVHELYTELCEKLLQEYIRAATLAKAEGLDFDKYRTTARAQLSSYIEPDEDWAAQQPKAFQTIQEAAERERGHLNQIIDLVSQNDQLQAENEKISAQYLEILARYRELLDESQAQQHQRKRPQDDHGN